MKWKPETEEQHYTYLIAKNNWNEFVNMGNQGTEHLIDILENDFKTSF